MSSIKDVHMELTRACELLSRVAEQDIEEKDGKIYVKRGVARDRIVCVTDPEMRHGHKTTSNRADGYKGKVMVSGEDGDFIGAVDADPANDPDSGGVCDLLDQQESHGAHAKELIADSAFGGMDTRDEIEKKGVDLIAKLPPDNNKQGYFTKDDFEIDLEKMCARCPAGQVTNKTRRARDEKHRTIRFFVFDFIWKMNQSGSYGLPYNPWDLRADQGILLKIACFGVDP